MHSPILSNNQPLQETFILGNLSVHTIQLFLYLQRLPTCIIRNIGDEDIFLVFLPLWTYAAFGDQVIPLHSELSTLTGNGSPQSYADRGLS